MKFRSEIIKSPLYLHIRELTIASGSYPNRSLFGSQKEIFVHPSLSLQQANAQPTHRPSERVEVESL